MTEFDISRMRAIIEREMERIDTVAKRLSRDAGLNDSAVRDLLRKVDDPRIKTLFKIARVLELRPSALLGDDVLICGLVGAEGVVQFFPEESDVKLFVPCPPTRHKEVRALRVATDELEPFHRRDDLLFFSRASDAVEPNFVGEECIVRLLDGQKDRGYLKTLSYGSEVGTFSLMPPPSGRVIPDVRLAWAAPILLTSRARNGL